MKIYRYFALLVSLAASGCSTTQTVYQVEVCLADREQKDDFVSFMRGVAQRSNLVFADGSTEIENDARTIAQAEELAARAGEVIYFGAESKTDEGGFTAGNLGLNTLQIGVGMTPTRDASFGRLKINQTIIEIGRQWRARRIPASQTFTPRPGCGDTPN